jgi:hypothetical protein
MLKYWSMNDLPSFFSSLYSCVLVGDDKFQFHEGYILQNPRIPM